MKPVYVATARSRSIAASILITVLMTPAFSRAEGFADIQLLMSARQGDIAGVDAAIKAGANINYIDLASGDTPLGSAAYYGKPEVVKALLAQGADPNAGTAGGGIMGTAFQEAVSRGHYDLAEAILTEAQSPVNAQAKTLSLSTGPLLTQVVDAGDANLLDQFLTHATSIDPNAADAVTGWTALDHAFVHRRPDLALMMVTRLNGWHFAAMPVTGETSLDNCAMDGNSAVLQAMLTKSPLLSPEALQRLAGEVRLKGDKAMAAVLLSYLESHYPQSPPK